MNCKCRNCGYTADRKLRACPKCGSQVWMEMSGKIDEIYGKRSKKKKEE